MATPNEATQGPPYFWPRPYDDTGLRKGRELLAQLNTSCNVKNLVTQRGCNYSLAAAILNLEVRCDPSQDNKDLLRSLLVQIGNSNAVPLDEHAGQVMTSLLGHYGGNSTYAAANVLLDVLSTVSLVSPAPWQMLFDLFDAYTNTWRNLGIGPIRTLYYLDLVAGLDDHGNSVFRFTDHPFFDHHCVAITATDWLIKDMTLDIALRTAGISWLDVETVMYDEFCGALPPAFDAAIRGVPSSLVLVIWAQYLHNWIKFNSNRTMLQARTKSLVSRLPGDAQYRGQVQALLADVSPIGWLAKLPGLNLKDFGTNRRSPIIQPIIEAIRDAIWDGIDYERMDLTLNRPAYVDKILSAKLGEDYDRKNYPDDLWQLVADIICHLSIIKGLPQHPCFASKTPLGEFMSWDAVRQRCSA